MMSKGPVDDEGRFELLADASADSLWDWNLVTGELWWRNSPYSRYAYKLKKETATVEAWKEYVHPEDRERIFEDFYRAISGKKNKWQGEYRYQRADGSWAHILGKCTILYDDGGRAVRALGAAMDISERLEQELELRRLTQTLHEKIMELDCLYRLSLCFYSPEASLDEQLEEAAGILCSCWSSSRRTWCRIVYGAREYRAGFAGGETSALKKELSLAGKRVGLIEVGGPGENPATFSEEEKKLFRTAALKIQSAIEMHVSRGALLQSEKRFRSIFDQAAEFVFVIGMDGKISDANRYACSRLGYERSRLLRMPFSGVELDFTREALAALIERLQKGEDVTLESVLLTIKQEQITVEKRVSLVDFEAGVGILLRGRDITERQAAERKLEEKNLALRELVYQVAEEKTKMQKDVAANIDVSILPLLEKAEESAPESTRGHLAHLRKSLEKISEPFGREISARRYGLTPKELEVCNLIRNGLSTKEISRSLKLAPATVETHRNRIRRKLGIRRGKINLASFLRGI